MGVVSMAMKFSHAFFGLGVLALSAAPALAKPAYVVSPVNLRAGPGTGDEIVGKIPSGSLVDADNCTDGWCAVTWQNKSGFAIQSALDLSGRVPRRAGPPPGYVEGPDEVVVGPPVYYDPPPPVYYGPYYRHYWGWRHRW
jgi:uncharacterized protein YraI